MFRLWLSTLVLYWIVITKVCLPVQVMSMVMFTNPKPQFRITLVLRILVVLVLAWLPVQLKAFIAMLVIGVAVKEFSLSYYIWETILITIYTHYGNLN